MSEGSTASVDELPEVSDIGLCTKCDRELSDEVRWCQQCGYFAEYDSFVEVDTDCEREPTEPGDHKLPGWVYIIGGISLLVLLISFSSLFLTAPHSYARLQWAVAQLSICGLALVASHLLAFFHAILSATDVGLLDIFTSPFGIWKHTIKSLPQGWTRLALGWNGFLGFVLGLTVVNGIPWGAILLDNAPAKEKRPNLAAAMLANANIKQEDMTMEEAIQEFQEAAGVDELEEEGEGDGEEDSDWNEHMTHPYLIDCVILGFYPTERNGVKALVLAAEKDGRLQYVGTVSQGLDTTTRFVIRRKVPGLVQTKPFIHCPTVGEVRWLKPSLTCRVRYHAWNDQGTLDDPRFEELLADLPVR